MINLKVCVPYYSEYETCKPGLAEWRDAVEPGQIFTDRPSGSGAGRERRRSTSEQRDHLTARDTIIDVRLDFHERAWRERVLDQRDQRVVVGTVHDGFAFIIMWPCLMAIDSISRRGRAGAEALARQIGHLAAK